MLKPGNKGEWSEIYAFLKLVSDRKLVSADANLNPIPGQDLDVLEIIREETPGVRVSYDLNLSDVEVQMREHGSGEVRMITVPADMTSKLAGIFSKLITGSNTAAFALPETDELAQLFGLNSHNGMPAGGKEDIAMVIHDPIRNQNPQVAYSIKSQAGAPATLLNASGATNIIYELAGENLPALEILNQAGSASDRLAAAVTAGGQLKYDGYSNMQFKENLMLIDTAMPEIIARLVSEHYLTRTSALREAIAALPAQVGLEECNVEISRDALGFKVKQLLLAAALGMLPSKPWNGRVTATGGYLIVKNDGSIVCFHIFNRDDFKDYLFANIKFERGSETKHQYGSFYSEGGAVKIKLNLQLRFIS